MNLYFILGFGLGAILFFIIAFAIAKNRYVVEQKKVDDSVYEELNRIKEQSQQELDKIEAQKKAVTILVQQKEASQQDLEFLNKQKENLQLDVLKAQQTAEEVAQAFYKEKMEQVADQFDENVMLLGQDYQDQREKYLELYAQVQKECAEAFKQQNQEQAEKLKEIEIEKLAALARLKDLMAKVDTAVEASKRAELERTEKDFYRLNLSDSDLSDVVRLKEVEPYLHNKEVLGKLIWKTYYERPYTEMCNRVLGASLKMGIYKITSLTNNMPYVGQSVDIRTRWRDHIKAGLGINSSNNRLYTAMKHEGPENFTFELLEECTRDKLNEKERYWINFFHTEDFGLNSNKGVSK